MLKYSDIEAIKPGDPASKLEELSVLVRYKMANAAMWDFYDNKMRYYGRLLLENGVCAFACKQLDGSDDFIVEELLYYEDYIVDYKKSMHEFFDAMCGTLNCEIFPYDYLN